MLVKAFRRSRALLTHTPTCVGFSLSLGGSDHFKIMTLIKEKCSDKLELKFSYFYSLVCFLLFFIFVMMVIMILLAIVILLIIQIPHAVAQRCLYEKLTSGLHCFFIIVVVFSVFLFVVLQLLTCITYLCCVAASRSSFFLSFCHTSA